MPRLSSVRLAVVPLSVIAWLTLGVSGAPAFADASGTDAATAGSAHANPSAPGQLNNQAAAPVDATASDSSTADSSTADSSSITANGVVAPTTTSSASTSPADTSMGTAGTFGVPTQRQPLSGADLNPGGANNGGDCGAYCSTRHGAPSLNGNGALTSTGTSWTSGKPCAGCVGRADNKNPPGQRPSGSDLNKGYECDGNNGIGKGNPAHTSCQQPAIAPPSTCSSSGSRCQQNDCSSSASMCQQTDCSSSASGCPQNDCSSSASGCPQTDCSSSASGCPGGPCLASTTCGGSPCATSMSPGALCSQSTPGQSTAAPASACVPTQANAFCTTVEAEHITRTAPTETTPVTQTTVSPRRVPAARVPAVIGEKLVQTPPPAATLPFTGSPVDGMVLTSILALACGGVLVRAGRRKAHAGPLG